MNNVRYRSLYYAGGALVLLWLAVWGALALAERSKMTAEKFTASASELNLKSLNEQARARALRDLAAKLTQLSLEERRRVRMSRAQGQFFDQLTEQEKAGFIEATMPTGFKQMLSSFEQLAPDKRQKAIENAVKNLRNQRNAEDPTTEGSPPPAQLSPDLQKRIVSVGLQTFYRESSAQTKAEMGPLLEEIQRTMESGRLFRPR